MNTPPHTDTHSSKYVCVYIYEPIDTHIYAYLHVHRDMSIYLYIYTHSETYKYMDIYSTYYLSLYPSIISTSIKNTVKILDTTELLSRCHFNLAIAK